jgi:type II secretory pathway component GspD/PulD (secretin)
MLKKIIIFMIAVTLWSWGGAGLMADNMSAAGTGPNFWDLIKQKKISIDFKTADLDDALRLLSQQNNINFYLVDKVRGRKINFYFKDVPIEDVLKSVLSNSGFAYKVYPEKNVVEISAADPNALDTRVFSIKNMDPLQIKTTVFNVLSSQGNIDVDRESKVLVITDTYKSFNRIIDVIDALDVKSGATDRSVSSTEIQTKVFTLQYANAAKVKDSIAKSLSSEGSADVDESLNALVVKDQAGILDRLSDLVLKLDRETPQVIISAELVEINSGVLSEIGAKWIYQPGNHGQTYTFNQVYNTPPVDTDTQNLGFVTQALGSSMVYGEVSDKFRAMINALVTTNKAEILSNPMITVVNNEKAKIEITDKFPYNQFSGYDAKGNPQYAIDFIDVGITMAVTPHIKEGNVVNLELEPEVSFQNGQNVGIPIRSTRKASTKVNVRDGKTIVIGGLTSNRKTKSVYKIPILGSIPLLGALFRSTSDNVEKVDLMIFVTPRIVTSSRIEEFSRENRLKFDTGKK